MGDVYGLTIALNCGDNEHVLAFYSQIFDRPPDTAPMDNFLEWRVAPGTWLQLSTGHDRPGANNARVRFEVADIDAAIAGLASLDVPVGDVVEVPGVVRFANFSDEWGNALGFYQLLAPRDIVSEAQRRRDARQRSEDVPDAVGAVGASGAADTFNAAGPSLADARSSELAADTVNEPGVPGIPGQDRLGPAGQSRSSGHPDDVGFSPSSYPAR